MLFSELRIRGMAVKNRIAMSPMLTYAAGDDGHANETHFVHYGARVLGGAGLVMSEIVAVSPQARIEDRGLGIWADSHVEGLLRITGFAKEHGVRTGVQLQHAGRKSWLDTNEAPSAIAYGDFRTPAEMSERAIEQTVDDYRNAARRSVEAGFDCIEITMAHGYLLHEFLASRTNRREDRYGGSLEGRMRLPLQVVEAVRGAIPDSMPVFVRFTAEDFLPDGVDARESEAFAGELVAAGVDLLDVTTGNLEPTYDQPVYPGYQADFAARLKQTSGALVAAMGGIHDASLADYLVSSGRADLVFMGRALLRDPNWPYRAAEQMGIEIEPVVPIYSRATHAWERGY